MSDQEGLDSFTAKWRARWPEWSVAEVFVPREERAPALAWAALLQELTDAAWGGSDPRPGEAKLGWWVEELQGWSRGLRRHPLGQVLQKMPAPWMQLAATLPSLRASRERPLDAADATAQLKEFAEAAEAIEQVLFAGTGDAGNEAILTGLLHMRLAHYPNEAVPLQVLAQGGGDGIAAWTRHLALHRSPPNGTRPRRVWTALASARLQRVDAARPLSAPRALWTAWHAARSRA